MKRLKKHFLVGLLLLVSLAIITCDSLGTEMGFGPPIDFIPPVLTLDPGSNPRFVKQGSVITGTVKDNNVVSKVIMREAGSTDELFTAELLPDSKWRIELFFEFEPGVYVKKIATEIVAYDLAGNSIVEFLTLIVDIREPIIKNMQIERASGKVAWLEPYADLKELEDLTDPNGERSGNSNRYQNGWFTFKAQIDERETTITDVLLNIYDTRDPNTPIFPEPRRYDEGSSVFSPEWLMKEEEIIAAGKLLFGPSYETDYYNNGKRYYYRVSITAYDSGENSDELANRVEDQQYFVLWEESDVPKGVLDAIIGSTYYRKMTLPVTLFDDDSVEWAYVGFVTTDQWSGYPGSTTDEKILYLKERLRAGDTIYNWKADIDLFPHYNGIGEPVREYIGGKNNVSELLIQIPTGDHVNDYGNYKLFTIVQDKKLLPHTGTGNVDTLRSRWKGRVYDINIIDDNVPLIVFDTVDTTLPGYNPALHPGNDSLAPTGNSPEENTFPKLRPPESGENGYFSGVTGGRYFEINGYTLRENNSGNNYVKKFMMAWIPHSIITDPQREKELIKQVEDALRYYDTPEQLHYSFPDDVQYWRLSGEGSLPSVYWESNNFITGEEQDLDEAGLFIKQSFYKKFDILGGADDLKPEYNNFTYKGKLENENKLFVFCAVDNLEKAVYRTLRLLANREKPTIKIYDITGKSMSLPANIPNPFEFPGGGTGDITPEYIIARNDYNTSAYSTLKTVGGTVTDSDLTSPFQIYPRGTILKYWVEAIAEGGLSIKSILMEDVTESAATVPVGHSNIDDGAVGYVEYFPEVTSRVYKFTVTNALDVVQEIQRTISITNAATLRDITTTELDDSTHGIGKVIRLSANFDGQIKVEGTPVLNITYGYPTQFKALPMTAWDALSIHFDFTVEENMTSGKDGSGIIKTMYNNAEVNFNTHPDRPITLPSGARILDVTRNDDAFTPGNIQGYDWLNSTGSLQAGKRIKLDGIRPSIDALAINGKTATSTGSGPTAYYYRGGEPVEFEITAAAESKNIKTLGTVSLSFYIKEISGTERGPYNTFSYRRMNGDKGVVFVLDVNGTNVPYNGEIVRVSLNGRIVCEDVGNDVIASTVNEGAFSNYLSGKTVIVDQKPPVKPESYIGSTKIGDNPTTVININTNPNLDIRDSLIADEPWGTIKQYSIDGGNKWEDYTSPYGIPNGLYNLRTRYIDAAGNEGATTDQLIHVNLSFPKLLSVTTVQPDSTYTAGGSLSFVLDFDEAVRVNNIANVRITLTNRNSSNTHNDGGTYTWTDGSTGGSQTVPSYQIVLRAAANQTNIDRVAGVAGSPRGNTSIQFDWPAIAGKEMLNGLYISDVTITGLQDRFGNSGGTGTATSGGAGQASAITINTAAPDPVLPYQVNNLNHLTQNNTSSARVIVDAIAPRRTGITPAVNDTIATSIVNNNQITLTFNEPVAKGTGTITVRPRGIVLTGDGTTVTDGGTYAIPAVFENSGYFLAVNGTRHTTPASDRTYIDGFYDIYTSNLLAPADKQTLARSTDTNNPDMNKLVQDTRTQHNTGPYLRITHGLRAGEGYSGNYNNTTPGADGPSPVTGYMIPDTTTKWVLDYRYSIHNNANTQYANDNNVLTNADTTVVPNIRTVLTKAKFRWQEIDVISPNVVISGSTVTITLNEPLLKGLEWEIGYPAGTFTDVAGNTAAGLGTYGTGTNSNVLYSTTHYFWSHGVQTPVIRVNRKSFDARTANWANVTGRTYSVPANLNSPGGWGIGDLNTVHYKIESETPNASIYFATQQGTAANNGSITGGWTNVTGGINWVSTGAGTSGDWVANNLVRRDGGTTGRTYTVTENGFTTTREITQDYRGYRSYNRDVTKATLDGLTIGTAAQNNGYQGSFTYAATEARKDYVVAEAVRGSQRSDRAYEGVFRSVVMINQGSFGGWLGGANQDANPFSIQGSNIKNGMPSIAGFPVRDAADDDNNRYIKLFYRNAYTANTSGQFVWVSTEIVSQWYVLISGRRASDNSNTGGTHMQRGEANNYLTAGYGDLTYSYNQR